VAAIPGFILGALFGLIVREPKRGTSDGFVLPAQTVLPLNLLGRDITYLLVVGAAMTAMFGMFACVQWFPAYLIRTYHMTEGAVGALLGPIVGALGVGSLLAGGYTTDLLSRRDIRWALWIPAIGCLAGAPLLACSFYVDNRSATLALFGMAYFFVMLQSAPVTSMIQSLVPVSLRARATAIFMLTTTLAGFGIGPTVAGFLSEVYRPQLGQDSLRYALLTLTPALFISPMLFAYAAHRLGCRSSAAQTELSVIRTE
jgi:MFS family permease